MNQRRQTLRDRISSAARGWQDQKPEFAFLTPPSRASRKRDITAGQRGGLDKVGSRSLPNPESGRDRKPKFITK